MISHLAKAAFLTFMASIGLWIGWMLIDNQRPYIYDQRLSKITPDPAPQHSMVVVDWKIDRINRLCPGSLQRTLFDPETGEKLITYDSTPAAMSVGPDDTHLTRAFMLPPIRLPPEVVYQGDVCFRCNPLQAFFPLCVKTPKLKLHIQP